MLSPVLIAGVLIAGGLVAATGRASGVPTTTTGDPTHDNGGDFDPHGDVTGVAVTYLAGSVTVSVTVATYDDPLGDAWQDFDSGPVWHVDTTMDQSTDFTVTLLNDGLGAVLAKVESAGAMLCAGVPATDSVVKTYSVTFPAACIGTPATVAASVLFVYSPSNESLSFDITAWTANAADNEPNAPANVHATAGVRRATVTWDAATTDGSAITGYQVSATQNSALAATVGAGVHSATVTGLTGGKSYTFRVVATSAVGPSVPGPISNAVVPLSPPPPTQTQTPRSGYWMLGSDGHVYPFGAAVGFSGRVANATAMAARHDGKGYWVVDSTGHVFAQGTAHNFGGAPSLLAGETISTISATPNGNGYWLFSNKGRVFPFGAAKSYGDMSGAALNGPIVASSATPTGHGYYLVGSDGGIFSFGDARFRGSTGNIHLNRPIVGISPTPDGHGYWLVASDGGVFAFNASFRGSMGSAQLNKPVDGLVAFGNGYLMVAADGGIFNFSNRAFFGSLASNPPTAPIVGVAAFST